ncbi:MAG: hypothetical protein GC201_06705 [Alphaproteobacteria bacterium]|nr:hypothetical protein [Alphaproteobacteria bacterium]
MLQISPDRIQPVPAPPPGRQRRAFWLRQLHAWHWVSAGLCLIGMLLFAGTGITLNHAAGIESNPRRTTREAVLPPALLTRVTAPEDGKGALPDPVGAWIRDAVGADTRGVAAEWSDGEAYVPLPRPGGDAWLSLDTRTGEITYERTDRGWVSYLNDLHKGRNTGSAWRWFIDLFAAACVIFSVTGLFLLQLHARRRRATWPVVGAGLAIPLLLALLFIH